MIQTSAKGLHNTSNSEDGQSASSDVAAPRPTPKSEMISEKHNVTSGLACDIYIRNHATSTIQVWVYNGIDIIQWWSASKGSVAVQQTDHFTCWWGQSYCRVQLTVTGSTYKVTRPGETMSCGQTWIF